MPEESVQYANASYRGGQHGFFAFGFEPNGMIAPDAKELGPGPSALKFAGYTGVWGVEQPEGTAPVMAAGSRRALQFVPGARQPSISNTLTLGSGANVLELLRCFLSADTTIPAQYRHMCLPVVAISGGAFDQCGTTLNFHNQARCAMGNTLQMNIQEGQPASANVNFLPVCVQKGLPDITGLNDAALKLAGGEVYAWQHLEFAFGGVDYTDIMSNAGLSVNNNLRRGPMRGLKACAGANLAARKANPLYRAPRQIIVGSEQIGVNLGLVDKLPDTMDGEYEIGQLRFVLSNDIREIAFEVETNFMAGQNQSATGAEAPMGFSCSILSSDLKITSSLI